MGLFRIIEHRSAFRSHIIYIGVIKLSSLVYDVTQIKYVSTLMSVNISLYLNILINIKASIQRFNKKTLIRCLNNHHALHVYAKNYIMFCNITQVVDYRPLLSHADLGIIHRWMLDDQVHQSPK